MTLFHELAIVASSHPILALTGLLAVFALYRLLRQPLRLIPGPFLTSVSSLPLYYHSYIGDECSWIDSLHARHGPVLRIAPNEVSIADGAALNTVYVEKGGFRKAKCYSNFDIEGHPSIFSAIDPVHRATRAKLVVPMFAMATVRSKATPVLEAGAARFVDRVKAGAASGQPVNVLNIARCLAVDSVTGYLFEKSYNGLEEAKDDRLSASPFVDAFVAVGRFFLLPNPVFLMLEKLAAKFFADKHVDDSMNLVHDFVTQCTEAADPEADDTYQARMLRAGISKHEVAAQLMDLMFAGTDSTAMALGTICFHLARNKEQYKRLHDEVTSNSAASVDPQTLPYLRGVIREGLRLGRANPTRFPREVPAGGWSFRGYRLPAGTNVGVQNMSLHFGATFKNAASFVPERWQDATPEMQRDYFPFGLGNRACIAQNLATTELFIAVRRIIESDVLRHAGAVESEIEILQWFNSKVKNERIDLIWDPARI